MARAKADSALAVVIIDRQRRHRVNRARLRRVLQEAAVRLAVGGEVAVLLTGDRTIRALNARYRHKDRPTDVLSFPGPGGEEGLGDIVISVATAARNASERGHRLAHELDDLVLHGLLHLVGYDHETDDGCMQRLERRLRRQLPERRS